jgi:predicted HAD superfamily Cof-like phosphohydrolase
MASTWIGWAVTSRRGFACARQVLSAGSSTVVAMDGLPSSLVRQFHEVFGLAAPDRPTTPPGDLVDVRQRLLEEEVSELADAVRRGRLDEVARELADVVYVAYGTAVTYGIDLDAVLREVHRANMSKLGPDGRPLIRDGKVQRGSEYRPPDVAAVLARQCDG